MSVKVNLKGVRKKLSPQAMQRGRYALGNQAMADMNQFVPRRDNHLRQSAYLSNSGEKIIYDRKYAKRQFYLHGKKYTTPGTGPRWDLKAKSLYLHSWEKAYLRGSGLN
ncbi:minor capsid protein [Enterococcus faecalis]|uniref:minor capsid protein n=1 Tax=Enterococcus faecalis TaxID=1351 RepID=UPI003D112EE7